MTRTPMTISRAPKLTHWMACAAVFATVAAAGALHAGCNDDWPTATPCTEIPEGGCPLSRGVACEDPACAAVYACREGNQWEFVRECPARPDAGEMDAGEVDAGEVDAAPSADASIDAPEGAYGGPGCGYLQAPDCNVGLALACGAGCCGCEDLFVCKRGGWELWGICGDAGIEPL